MTDLSEMTTDDTGPIPDETGEGPPAAESELALVRRIMAEVRLDKAHHAPAFKRMRRDMFVATNGRTEDWSGNNYAANITGRHINQKVAGLYAKNPKAAARRRDTLDFQLWDETTESLSQATQILQAAQQMQPVAQIDPMTGQAVLAPPPMPPGFAEAQALMADVQQGMAQRETVKRVGRTLEVLFAYFMAAQNPLDFKESMKQLVRRACTVGVGYLKYDFLREMGADPLVSSRLQDSRARLEHLSRLVTEAQTGDIESASAEMAELQATIADLEAQPEIVLQEGLVFDFPQSTRVIPDRLCTNLQGWIGARRVTIEHIFPRERVEEMFNIKLGSFTPYKTDSKTSNSEWDAVDKHLGGAEKKSDLVLVYEVYDRPSGLVYMMADGYDRLLRPAAGPNVKVENFFPIEALTFNAVESEDCVFPPSDVALMLPMQEDYNRSRQGQREHRKAARPRFAAPRGVLGEDEMARLGEAEAFSVVQVNMDPGEKIGDKLQPIPVPGVDPNLYETGQLFTDIQLVVGTQEAQLGGVAKATATESSIAASAAASSTGSNVDDLDTFLTRVARASSQILLREMSEEQVRKIAGVGAVWPTATLKEIMEQVWLEVEAGSSGKPNQAAEVANWERLLPALLQMPGIKPEWLARETLRRLDDRLDLNEAVVAGLPAIVAQNRMAQPMVDAGADPAQQGDQGADNGPAAPAGPSGTGAAFGDNKA